MIPDFRYERRVSFSETDAMGVMHHANYLRFCEEARVAYLRFRGISHTHFPQNNKIMAVLQYQVWHLGPAFFDDLLSVQLQVRRVGLKMQFQYAIYKDEQRVAEAETWHIPVDRSLQPVRPDKELMEQLERESEAWTETWRLNS